MSKPILVLGQLVQVLSDRIGTVNVLVFINNVTMHERVFACTRNAKPIAEAIELICTLPAHDSSLLMGMVSYPGPPEESLGMRLTAV